MMNHRHRPSRVAQRVMRRAPPSPATRAPAGRGAYQSIAVAVRWVSLGVKLPCSKSNATRGTEQTIRKPHTGISTAATVDKPLPTSRRIFLEVAAARGCAECWIQRGQQRRDEQGLAEAR